VKPVVTSIISGSTPQGLNKISHGSGGYTPGYSCLTPSGSTLWQGLPTHTLRQGLQTQAPTRPGRGHQLPANKPQNEKIPNPKTYCFAPPIPNPQHHPPIYRYTLPRKQETRSGSGWCLGQRPRHNGGGTGQPLATEKGVGGDPGTTIEL